MATAVIRQQRALETAVYGLMAEFRSPEDLLDGARRMRAAGYRKMDAHTPFPVHGLAEVLQFEDARVPWAAFISGVVGAIAGFVLQAYTAVIDYPINSGGRPYLSIPSFMPATFECAVMFAALGVVFAMMGLNGLPMPHHPVFGAPRFERASQDAFFLCVEASDPQFDLTATDYTLRSAGAIGVSAVDLDEEDRD